MNQFSSRVDDISANDEYTEKFDNQMKKSKIVNFHINNDESHSVDASTNLYNKIKSSITVASFKAQKNAINFINKKPIRVHNTSLLKSFNMKLLKFETFNLLERPSGNFAFFYRLFTFTIILLTILFSAFTTMGPDYSHPAKNTLFFIEIFVTIYFFIEYCLRLWSSGCRSAYTGFKGKIKFMLRPIMVIELFAFFFGVILIIGSSQMLNFSRDDKTEQSIYFGPIALTILRFLQLIRLLYVDRKAHTWILLLDVCYKHKFELISSVYIGFITLLLSSYLIYHCEKSVKDSLFRTYSDAVYWSIITMTTIGYGDIAPKTFYGKIIATGLCVLGVAFWTLPGGIIGSGFAFKIEQKNKIKKFNRLIPAAASLIQTWWRMKILFDLPTSNPARLLATLRAFEKVSTESDKIKKENNTSKSNEQIHDNEEKNAFLERTHQTEESRIHDFLSNKLRPQTVIVIRTILLLRYFAAKTKFKFAHKPYDFKDVIEQYTKGNMDILIKIKELQRKLDQTTNSQKGSILNATSRRKSVRHRRTLSFNESQNSEDLVFSLENRIESIENKLDDLIRLFNANNNINNNNNNNDSQEIDYFN